VSEIRVLRRIFGSERGEMTGSWRKVHNEELHNYNQNDQTEEDGVGRACSTNWS
jgi:hypothetical protein